MTVVSEGNFVICGSVKLAFPNPGLLIMLLTVIIVQANVYEIILLEPFATISSRDWRVFLYTRYSFLLVRCC